MTAVLWPAGAPTGNCTVWNSINWKSVDIVVKRLQMRIAKVVNGNSRAVWKDLALEMLEPYDGKLSRTVLRGLGAGNAPRLPDRLKNTGMFQFHQFEKKELRTTIERIEQDREPPEKPISNVDKIIEKNEKPNKPEAWSWR